MVQWLGLHAFTAEGPGSIPGEGTKIPQAAWLRQKNKQKTMRYHYTPIKMAKIQNTDNTRCWQTGGTTGTLIHYRWECKMAQPLWKTVWQFSYKTKHMLTIQSSNCAPWYLSSWVENLCSHKNLHTDVYSSFIHNCQNLKATRMSFSRWMDK